MSTVSSEWLVACMHACTDLPVHFTCEADQPYELSHEPVETIYIELEPVQCGVFPTKLQI